MGRQGEGEEREGGPYAAPLVQAACNLTARLLLHYLAECEYLTVLTVQLHSSVIQCRSVNIYQDHVRVLSRVSMQTKLQYCSLCCVEAERLCLGIWQFT